MKQFFHITFLILFQLVLVNTDAAIAGIFNRKVDSIKLVVDQNQLILPGESFEIGVVSYQKNDKIRKTIGMNSGSVLWWRYQSEIIGGTMSRGKIKVSSKLYPSKGKYISVKIWPRKHKELSQTLLIPLNYETKLSFSPLSDFDKAPGCYFKAELTVTYNNGISRKITNFRNSYFADNYSISPHGITLFKNRFVIESDFRNITNHQVNLFVQSKNNPAVLTNFPIQLDYKHKYNLGLWGQSGRSGFDGLDGQDGFLGENGTHGYPGGHGEPGYNGPDIGVWTDLYFDSTLNCELLYVYAEDYETGKEYYYLINPDGGQLKVSSKGGSGGNGGDGGDGGDGGRGKDGEIWYEEVSKTRIVQKPFTTTQSKTVTKQRTNEAGETEEYEETVVETVIVYRDVEETYTETIKHQAPGQRGGCGGDGGPGGIAGPGGWGGNIFLYFTNDAKQFARCIIPQSLGGSGGSHGYGGNGGEGGMGGNGCPDGLKGGNGYDAPRMLGWANNGERGEIIIGTTDEFFFYEPVARK